MPTDVQRGGEAEPDGPRSETKSEKTPSASQQKPADRGQGKVSPRTPGKAEGKESSD